VKVRIEKTSMSEEHERFIHFHIPTVDHVKIPFTQHVKAYRGSLP